MAKLRDGYYVLLDEHYHAILLKRFTMQINGKLHHHLSFNRTGEGSPVLSISGIDGAQELADTILQLIGEMKKAEAALSEKTEFDIQGEIFRAAGEELSR